MIRRRFVSLSVAPALLVAASTAWAQADPLPSWNKSTSKRAILDSVARTAVIGGSHFASNPERIGIFDDDGTLRMEQPIYFQFAFAIDRVKMLALAAPARKACSRSWQLPTPA